jgi:hypothetical protein
VLGSLLLAAYDPGGELVYVGDVGSGFTDAVRRWLLGLLRPLHRDDPLSPAGVGVPQWSRWDAVALLCEEHAFQCGFCLSGMVLASQELLETTALATVNSEVISARSGP